MKTRIGQLRERLVIQSATEAVSTEGQPEATWTTLAALPDGCAGRAEFLAGDELQSAQKISVEISVRFTVRYRTDITEKMRVSWRSKVWNIHSVIPDERTEFMALLVSKTE